ncbi:ead/Ea22-like family protein [Cronobacter sakazakii]|nr:ead/Ea22-like family protein [Cronobacter sakazakii]
MMTIDIAKLKAAAEQARWGDWSAYKPHSGARGYEVRVGSEAVAQHCLKDDAAFIAEASPKAVLELIAALEAAEKRNAELEREHAAFRPVGVMSEGAFHRLENSECRFIALWPRPGIYLPRKRPDDGVVVYARTELVDINLETGGEA